MSENSWIIYDGQCPFCTNYVRLLRLKGAVGNVRLIDARENGDYVAKAQAQGHDLDEGFVFHYGGRDYHGADAIHMLASLSSPVGIFNRLNGWVFASPRRARFLYPILRAGRMLTLKLLGRSRISQLS